MRFLFSHIKPSSKATRRTVSPPIPQVHALVYSRCSKVPVSCSLRFPVTAWPCLHSRKYSTNTSSSLLQYSPLTLCKAGCWVGNAHAGDSSRISTQPQCSECNAMQCYHAIRPCNGRHDESNLAYMLLTGMHCSPCHRLLSLSSEWLSILQAAFQSCVVRTICQTTQLLTGPRQGFLGEENRLGSLRGRS